MPSRLCSRLTHEIAQCGVWIFTTWVNHDIFHYESLVDDVFDHPHEFPVFISATTVHVKEHDPQTIEIRIAYLLSALRSLPKGLGL